MRVWYDIYCTNDNVTRPTFIIILTLFIYYYFRILYCRE